MNVIYSAIQQLHNPKFFLSSGAVLPNPEVPQRADRLSAAYRRMLKRVGLRYGVL